MIDSLHPKIQPLAQQLSASPKFAETRLLGIIDFLREQLDDLIDGMGGVDPVISAVNAIYDQYVAPIDVPWVPDVLEPTIIDRPAKQLLAAIIRRLHDQIHTP